MTQLLQNAAAGTVLILVTALLRLALKKRLPSEVWLVLWAVCLLRLLTPAALESRLSVYTLSRLLPAVPAAAAPAPSDPAPAPSVPAPAPASPPAPGGAVVLPGTVPSRPAPDSGVTPPAQTPPAGPALDPGTLLWAALAAIWLLGAAVTAVRLILSWRRTRRAVNCAPLLPRSDPRYAALPPGVRLREGPVEGAPLTFGAVRPTVVLSPGLSGAALACVLAHEGVHARRRDNLWHYAVALARTVFWWNPAVWLMERLLRRDIELSCDRAALRRMGLHRRQEYAMTILDMSIQGEGAPFSRAFGQKQAEERIIAIMKYKKMTALALALSILLVCGVIVGFATDPVDNADEPAITDTEPADNTADPAPAGTEPVETEPAPVETEPTETEPVPTETEPAATEPVESVPVPAGGRPTGNDLSLVDPARVSFRASGIELGPAGPGFTAPTRFSYMESGTEVDFAGLGFMVPPAPEGTPEDMLSLWEFAWVMGQYEVLRYGPFQVGPEGTDSANHSNKICLHLNQTPDVSRTFMTLSDSVHGGVGIVFMCCNDCGNVEAQLDETEIWTEEHSFEPGKYLGTDHSAADPAEHCYLYEHTCDVCEGTYEYTTPIGCPEDYCVEFNSVTPEPEVNSADPVESEPEFTEVDMARLTEEVMKTLSAYFQGKAEFILADG